MNKLEMNAVRPYINIHKPVIVAVDIDDIPQSLIDEYNRVINELKKLAGPNGDFYNSVSTNKRNAAIYGFKYLNSEHGMAHSEAVSEATMKGLGKINDESLTDAYNA